MQLRTTDCGPATALSAAPPNSTSRSQPTIRAAFQVALPSSGTKRPMCARSKARWHQASTSSGSPDGSVAGTQQINPPSAAAQLNPYNLTAFGTKLVFAGTSNFGGGARALWITDGTTPGTNGI